MAKRKFRASLLQRVAIARKRLTLARKRSPGWILLLNPLRERPMAGSASLPARRALMGAHDRAAEEMDLLRRLGAEGVENAHPHPFPGPAVAARRIRSPVLRQVTPRHPSAQDEENAVEHSAVVDPRHPARPITDRSGRGETSSAPPWLERNTPVRIMSRTLWAHNLDRAHTVAKVHAGAPHR